ncbi:large conductance mechanosensitive channel protein MscL [uncultured Faecalicoccus sp.]|uniref:large conductance mechanosensitive channel protein MscL n=1 Tax=uncultured Faecalicoccus sp. TaxID=1971760 RepID=UPI0026022334|nr:large conductance mechanosensitive channel protein MscL [uncultured Faecalicoccus sp.]
MKKFIEEFKSFALRGNVMDMAVGVLIGGAFTSIVTALTTNFIQPILDVVTGAKTYTLQDVAGFGTAFISAVVNFLITALVLFILLKSINKLMSLSVIKKKEEEEAAPTTKICPFCKSEISIEATRCPHCTSELDK